VLVVAIVAIACVCIVGAVIGGNGSDVENNNQLNNPVVDENTKTLAMFVGSEGGFEEAEIELLKENGATALTLGSRILRAQTAPIAGIAGVMYQTKNLE
ncbi:MAG: RNA methyltransferase, partial [Bacteroidales bacterium]|nr:RNA methyltransferase [Bacteroidales bacterium]